MDRSVKKPIIGVVGEIYVRSNKFSNEDLVRKLETLGAEVRLAGVEEWLYYLNIIGTRRAIINRDWSTMVDYMVKKVVKGRVERGQARHYEGFLNSLHEPTIKELFKKAAPYVSDSFEGETVLSIGKAIDLAEKGASGIVNAMPFGCMPGTIVAALMRAVSRDIGIPFISIPYDGTESTTTRLQMEAFMDQAKAKL
jgi:predicted nucleotide-binding protein (sugar kinase/HSP70/actin superfamily)